MYWSITGGADQDKFVIDADTGALSFKTVDVDNNNAAIDLPEYVSLSDPNYDAATSNRFEVTIQASDSTDPAEGHTSDLTLMVNLVDGLAPSITSSDTFTLDEGDECRDITGE